MDPNVLGVGWGGVRDSSTMEETYFPKGINFIYIKKRYRKEEWLLGGQPANVHTIIYSCYCPGKKMTGSSIYIFEVEIGSSGKF